jgi:hypothetical protein
MTTRLGVGVIAFMCALVCAVAASFAVFEMVDKVNERLPVEQHFAPLGWYWSKYRGSLPNTRLLGRVADSSG